MKVALTLTLTSPFTLITHTNTHATIYIDHSHEHAAETRRDEQGSCGHQIRSGIREVVAFLCIPFIAEFYDLIQMVEQSFFGLESPKLIKSPVAHYETWNIHIYTNLH
jgi:hypothetical protein